MSGVWQSKRNSNKKQRRRTMKNKILSAFGLMTMSEYERLRISYEKSLRIISSKQKRLKVYDRSSD